MLHVLSEYKINLVSAIFLFTSHYVAIHNNNYLIFFVGMWNSV